MPFAPSGHTCVAPASLLQQITDLPEQYLEAVLVTLLALYGFQQTRHQPSLLV